MIAGTCYTRPLAILNENTYTLYCKKNRARAAKVNSQFPSLITARFPIFDFLLLFFLKKNWNFYIIFCVLSKKSLKSLLSFLPVAHTHISRGGGGQTMGNYANSSSFTSGYT